MSQMYKECDDRIAKYARQIESLTEENARLKAEVINKAHEYAELSGENDVLKAALKPVLDVHITQDDESIEVYDSTMDGVLSVRAVREAQRIHEEGVK